MSLSKNLLQYFESMHLLIAEIKSTALDHSIKFLYSEFEEILFNKIFTLSKYPFAAKGFRVDQRTILQFSDGVAGLDT